MDALVLHGNIEARDKNGEIVTVAVAFSGYDLLHGKSKEIISARLKEFLEKEKSYGIDVPIHLPWETTDVPA